MMTTIEAIDITPIQQIAEALWTEHKEDSTPQPTEGLETFSQKITGELKQVLGREFTTKYRSGRWPRRNKDLTQVWLEFAFAKDPKKPDSFINTSTIRWVHNKTHWSVEAIHEGQNQIGRLRKVTVTAQNQIASFIPAR